MQQRTIFAAVIVVIFAAACIYGWFSFAAQRLPAATPTATTSPGAMGFSVSSTTPASLIDASSSASSIPPGYSEYSNQAFHFSIYYPSNLTVQPYTEKGSALSVTFQDAASSSVGFQIFATPYPLATVDAARFARDEPSGVMIDPTNVLVDNVPGTMFYGSDSIIGDTREVWFIKSGILYEVSTYKPLDSWLAGIMQTWKFI